MGRATGDPRVHRITLPVRELTQDVRDVLAPVKTLAAARSRAVSTGSHVRTEFRWDITAADATPTQVEQARLRLGRMAGVTAVEVGPWGGQITRRVA